MAHVMAEATLGEDWFRTSYVCVQVMVQVEAGEVQPVPRYAAPEEATARERLVEGVQVEASRAP